jgi:hypothetical protein
MHRHWRRGEHPMKKTSKPMLLALGLTLLAGSASATTLSTGSCWTPTGSTSAYRMRHQAVLLPNGKVLAVGGYQSGGIPLASAEVYDPASGIWSPTGSMAVARHGHTAVLLPNGKVLVSGGASPYAPLASAELYDPASGTWSPTGSMAVPRYGSPAVLLPNGKVLVSGGTNGYLGSTLASVELYDPASGTWSPTGSMAEPRGAHTLTVLPNGKVLSAGDGALGVANRVDLYDPVSGTWSSGSPMSRTRQDHTTTLLPDGKVLVTGGIDHVIHNDAEVYDPASDTWSPAGTMAASRVNHTAVLLPNGQMLVVGGQFYSTTAAELYACGEEEVATCPDGSPVSEVTVSSGELSLLLQCPLEMTLECGVRPWVDPQVTATDGVNPLEVHKYNSGDDDGDGVPGSEDPDDYGPGPNVYAEGTYLVEYIAWNSGGTVSTLRTVHVEDSTPPALKLKGSATMTHVCGSAWVDPGVEASDTCNGELSHLVETAGYVNGWSEGTYTLTYSLTDSGGNSATPLTRTVQVVDCPW